MPHTPPRHILFNYSSFHTAQFPKEPFVFNPKPFIFLSPLERHKRRQRQRAIQTRNVLKQQQEELLRLKNAGKEEELVRLNRESMANYKVPPIDLLFPCLLSKAANIPVNALIHFCSCPATFKGRHMYYKERLADHSRMSTLLKRPFFVCELETLTKWFRLEQQLKFTFKKLLNHWIYHKYKGRQLNTEDPVTLQVPENPVYLFDVNRRGIYTFEASCLKKRIETELFYSEWLFPEPKHPKNPLTNIEFTECQKLSILQSLRQKGYGSWAFEAYRALCWNLEQFQVHYQTPLKLASLHDLIKNPSSEETIDYLQEFIEEQYDYHNISQGGVRISITVLSWAVEHEYSTPYMKQWLKLFEEYMKLKITIGVEEHTPEERRAYNTIYRQTKAQFNKQEDYTALQKRYMEAHKHLVPRVLVLPNVGERIAAIQEAERNQLDGMNPNRLIVRLASGSIRVIVPY